MTAPIVARHLSSFGFSGAGFLACYHLGVAQCLVKHGILLQPGRLSSENNIQNSPVLTGVSGGALVAAAVSAGIDLEQDGMNACLEIAKRTRAAGGLLDALYPGYVRFRPWLLFLLPQFSLSYKIRFSLRFLPLPNFLISSITVVAGWACYT